MSKRREHRDSRANGEDAVRHARAGRSLLPNKYHGFVTSKLRLRLKLIDAESTSTNRCA